MAIFDAPCSHRVGGHTAQVKYHLGQTTTREYPDGRSLTITVAPNPSHLEFCQPVVQGLVRALQRHGCDS